MRLRSFSPWQQQRQTAFLHGWGTAGTAEFPFKAQGQQVPCWVSVQTGCWCHSLLVLPQAHPSRARLAAPSWAGHQRLLIKHTRNQFTFSIFSLKSLQQGKGRRKNPLCLTVRSDFQKAKSVPFPDTCGDQQTKKNKNSQQLCFRQSVTIC